VRRRWHGRRRTLRGGLSLKALLLDLDDTLLDSSGDVDVSWVEACVTCTTARTVDLDQLMPALAATRRWFWEDPDRARRGRTNMMGSWQAIAAHALQRLGIDDADLAAAIARDFALRRRERMRLFPDALECLHRLRACGVGLALVTNGDAEQQRDKIVRHDLARFFDVILIEGEFGAGKPDPVVYRHALQALGVSAEAASMVGDHLEWDVGAPQRLGLRGIWIDRAGAGLPAEARVRPDRIIGTLRELIAGG
jgi:putative hydrolase of the HAD superfamily